MKSGLVIGLVIGAFVSGLEAFSSLFAVELRVLSEPSVNVAVWRVYTLYSD